MKKKWFRVAREGFTIDGRELKKSDLESMAKNYDPEIYQARINKEHIRGVVFLEEQFGSFGDVYELKTEQDKTGKTVLLALIEPLPNLVELNKKGQKVFTSIEMGSVPEFDGHYLVGLAVTDTPASTGTQMLKFSLSGDSKADSVKLFNSESLYSEYIEVEYSLDTASEPSTNILSKVKELLSGSAKKADKNFTEFSEAITQIAESQSGLIEQVSNFSADSDALQKITDDLKGFKTEIEAIKQNLSLQPEGEQRPPQTSDGQALTDC